jgi:FdhE protein
MLRGIHTPVDRALAPFLGAALQVCWVSMAGGLDAEKLARLENPGLCPACGTPPLAGIVCADPAVRGNRYLCCGLCATEWHMVRIKCSHCQSTAGIAYYAIEGSATAVKGETCQACRTYLKMMYEEEDTKVDAFADDLATIALDILLGEAGWSRLVPPPFGFTFHDGA